jgi:hypothetical protein
MTHETELKFANRGKSIDVELISVPLVIGSIILSCGQWVFILSCHAAYFELTQAMTAEISAKLGSLNQPATLSTALGQMNHE